MDEVISRLHATLNTLYLLDGSWRTLGDWPDATTGSQLSSGASEDELLATERALGHALPPSYKAFLRRHAGWEHFWGDFTLVGTGREQVRRALDEIAETTDEQTSDLRRTLGDGVAAGGVAAWEAKEARHLYLASHLVIATNFGGEHWVYDTRTRRADGELTLVNWTLDYGAQEPMFQTFLEFLEWTCSEVAARVTWLEARQANPSTADAGDDDDD